MQTKRRFNHEARMMAFILCTKPGVWPIGLSGFRFSDSTVLARCSAVIREASERLELLLDMESPTSGDLLPAKVGLGVEGMSDS